MILDAIDWKLLVIKKSIWRGRPPYWTSLFVIYCQNCRKSNIEENKLNFNFKIPIVINWKPSAEDANNPIQRCFQPK